MTWSFARFWQGEPQGQVAPFLNPRTQAWTYTLNSQVANFYSQRTALGGQRCDILRDLAGRYSTCGANLRGCLKFHGFSE